MNKGFRFNLWDTNLPMSVHKAMWKKMLRTLPANPNIEGTEYGIAAEVNAAAKEAEGNGESSVLTADSIEAAEATVIHNDPKEEDSKYEKNNVQDEWLPLDEMDGLEGSNQVILVTPVKTGKSWAKLRLYERIDGGWKKINPDMKAYIGMNGFKPVKNRVLSSTEKFKYKYEGDNATPSGIFTISSLFGWGENQSFAMPYKQTTGDDYWVSSSTKKEEYNALITRKGGPLKSWNIYEKLKIPEYKYAAVIDYNNGPNRIINNGSAIFLHASGNRDYTSGCVTLSEANLLKVLKWLKPESKPLIVLGKM